MANKNLKKQLRKLNQQRRMSSRAKAKSYPTNIPDKDWDSIANQLEDTAYYMDLADQTYIEHDMGGNSIYY